MINKGKVIFKKIIVLFFVASIFTTILFAFIPVPLTPLMLIRCVEKIAKGEMPILDKDYKRIENISPEMQMAVIAAEDQKFYEHFGFDIEAITKAFKSNKYSKSKGRTIKGGSTISQQTAKNVFLWPGRSYIRKGFEAYFTLLIEIFWSKKKILSTYLNIIELGDGIYGVEAASQHYFHKSASKLNRREAAALAAILPSPLKWSPTHPSNYVAKKKSWIVRQISNIDGSVKVYIKNK